MPTSLVDLFMVYAPFENSAHSVAVNAGACRHGIPKKTGLDRRARGTVRLRNGDLGGGFPITREMTHLTGGVTDGPAFVVWRGSAAKSSKIPDPGQLAEPGPGRVVPDSLVRGQEEPDVRLLSR